MLLTPVTLLNCWTPSTTPGVEDPLPLSEATDDLRDGPTVAASVEDTHQPLTLPTSFLPPQSTPRQAFLTTHAMTPI